MVSNKLKKQMMWLITVVSNRNFSDKDRDFIAELVSEEARKVIDSHSFILHDLVESKKYCKILIEGTKTAVISLLSVMKDNLPYKVCYTKYDK